jgi:hypothetical protein
VKKTARRKMLDRNEAIEILEDLARNGPDHAKVSAIRLLREIEREEPQEREPEGFEGLYEFPPRRGGNGKGAA